MTVQAVAADQVNGKRHSLILRPVAEHMHAVPSGLSSEAQTSIRATISPTTSSSPAFSPHRLAKYPDVERMSGIAAVHAPIPPSTRQTQLPAGSVVASRGVPVPVGPGQTPTTALSSTSQGTPIAAVASAKAGHRPVAGPRPAQPIAASGTGVTSRYHGSRAVMNLLNIPGLVNLLQAPLPPVVTTASNPPTSPKSTPQTAPSPSSNPQPSPSSGSSGPGSQAGNPSSRQPSSTPTPVQKTGTAVLSWNVGTENDLAGYKVYIGTASGTYGYPGSPFTIGRVTTYKVDHLPLGQTYYFALSAYDNAGNTSGLSAEVHKSIY